MSNMSYCRFENTARDLVDCRETLESMVEGDDGKLSRDELAAAKSLAEECVRILEILADVTGQDVNEFVDEGTHSINRRIAAAMDVINDEAGEDDDEDEPEDAEDTDTDEDEGE